jgi:hypothetical protein
MAQRRMWQACVTGILVLAASSLMAGQAPAAGTPKPDISVLLATHMQGAGLLYPVGALLTVSGPPGDVFGLEVAQQGTKRWIREKAGTIPAHGALVDKGAATGHDAGIFTVHGYVADRHGTIVYRSPDQVLVWSDIKLVVDSKSQFLAKTVKAEATLTPAYIYTGYSIQFVVTRGGSKVTEDCPAGRNTCQVFVQSPAESDSYRDISIEAQVNRPFLETLADQKIGLELNEIKSDPEAVNFKDWNLGLSANGKSAIMVELGTVVALNAHSDLPLSAQNPLHIEKGTAGVVVKSCPSGHDCQWRAKVTSTSSTGPHYFVAKVKGDAGREEPPVLKESGVVTVTVLGEWTVTLLANGQQSLSVPYGKTIKLTATSDRDLSPAHPLYIVKQNPTNPSKGTPLGKPCTSGRTCTTYVSAITLGKSVVKALVKGDPADGEPAYVARSNPVTITITAQSGCLLKSPAGSQVVSLNRTIPGTRYVAECMATYIDPVSDGTHNNPLIISASTRAYVSVVVLINGPISSGYAFYLWDNGSNTPQFACDGFNVYSSINESYRCSLPVWNAGDVYHYSVRLLRTNALRGPALFISPTVTMKWK